MRYFFIIMLVLLPAVALAVEVKPFQQIPFIDTNSTEGYINALYKASIAVAAFLVIFKLMWVGTKYMLTESVIKKGDAKGSIQNALIGLVIIISAALILGTINPNLLNLNAIEKVKPPEKFSDPVNVGGVQFKRGDIWEGSAVYDTCTSSSVFRDQNCVNQYLNTLNTICREDGGQMTIIRDQNVTTSWWRLALIPLNPTNAFTYSATSFACN